MKSFWRNRSASICFILQFGVSILILPKPPIHGERFPIPLQLCCPSREPQHLFLPRWRRMNKSFEAHFTQRRRRRRRRRRKAPVSPWFSLLRSMAAQMKIESEKHKLGLENETALSLTKVGLVAFVASLLATLNPSESLFSPLCSMATHMLIVCKQHKRVARRLVSIEVGSVVIETSFSVTSRPSTMRSKIRNNRLRTMSLEICTNSLLDQDKINKEPECIYLLW